MQPVYTAEVQPVAENDVLNVLLNTIRGAVGDANYRNWFESKAGIQLDDQRLTITVNSSFVLSWMQRRFAPIVIETVRQLAPGIETVWRIETSVETAEESASSAGSVADPVSKIGQSVRPEPARALRDVISISPPVGASSGARTGAATSPATGSGGRSVGGAGPREARRFARLDEFVSGACNELAVTAVKHVGARPGAQFNPLYLHGAVGTGKTHLAEAAYCEIRRQHPDLQIVFISAESFGNRFTQALRTQALPGFRQRFRNVDVLIVDDVGFFDGKRAIQEEFLHTFKQLETAGKQVIVTADSHPRLFSKMSDELVTRFLSGLVCRLETPDAATRLNIVRAKAIRSEASFAPDALEFVARRFQHNVRELEGAINMLQTWHSMTGRRVTQAAAREVLSELERDCIRVVRLEDIEAAICNLFGLSADDLRSGRRTKAVTQPRMLAMFLARRHTPAAYREIGDFFGGRNHSTVVAAEKKIEELLASGEQLNIGARRWHLTDIVETIEQQMLAG